MGFLYQVVRNISSDTWQVDKEFDVQTKTTRDLANADFSTNIGFSWNGDFTLAGDVLQGA